MSYEVIISIYHSGGEGRGGLSREKELQRGASAPFNESQFVPGAASSHHLANIWWTERKPKPFQAEGKSLLSHSSTPTEPCSTL